MAQKKRSANVPAGFVEKSNALAGFWKPDKAGDTLQGVVGHMIEVKGDRKDGKPNRFYSIRITDATVSGPIVNNKGEPVDDVAGELVGVGGAVLLSFLADQVGKEVFLIYKGFGKAKPGQSAPRLYATYAKEFDGETGEIVE